MRHAPLRSTLRAPPTIRTKCGPLREYIVCIRDRPPVAPVCASGRSSSNRDGSGGASSPSRRSDASGEWAWLPRLGQWSHGRGASSGWGRPVCPQALCPRPRDLRMALWRPLGTSRRAARRMPLTLRHPSAASTPGAMRARSGRLAAGFVLVPRGRIAVCESTADRPSLPWASHVTSSKSAGSHPGARAAVGLAHDVDSRARSMTY